MHVCVDVHKYPFRSPVQEHFGCPVGHFVFALGGQFNPDCEHCSISVSSLSVVDEHPESLG